MKREYIACVSLIALAAGLCGLGSNSAHASDLYARGGGYKDEPAIVAFPNWAGFYAGGHIGGGWGDGRGLSAQGGGGGGGGGGAGDNNWCKNLVGGCPGSVNGGNGGNANGGQGGNGGGAGLGAPGDDKNGGAGGAGGDGGEVTGSTGKDGVLGGLHLGYNWQRDNIVFGVEGDISLTGGLDDYLASLRARLGLASNDMLFYITGGLALRDGGGADAIGLAGAGGDGGLGGANDDGAGGDNAGEDAGQPGVLPSNGGDGAPGAVSGFDGDDGNDTGFVVGAGVEHMLSSNVSIGVEGLWYSFDDEDDLTVIRGRISLHLDRAAHPGFKDAYAASAIADWSGFYAGVNVGAGFGDGAASAKTKDGGAGTPGDPGVPSGLARTRTDGFDDGGGGGGGGGGGAAALITFDDDSSVLGGVHLGYNWQDGSYVFGIEGDANLADENFRDYLASLRLRVGHSFDNIMVYGTAGVAFAGRGSTLASVTLNPAGDGGDGEDGGFENNNPAPGGPGDGAGGVAGDPGTVTTASDDAEDKVGFVVGGGFEVKLWDRTSLGVEGLYYGFDGDGDSSTATSFTASDDLSTAVVRARMTFQLTGEQQSLK